MELFAQGRKTDSPTELHVSKPPLCTCCTTGTGEARKGMEVEVIDDADKSVKQQPSGRYRNTLLRGWQWRADIYHVGTGAVANRGQVWQDIYTQGTYRPYSSLTQRIPTLAKETETVGTTEPIFRWRWIKLPQVRRLIGNKFDKKLIRRVRIDCTVA
jgi:hypothetical protein